MTQFRWDSGQNIKTQVKVTSLESFFTTLGMSNWKVISPLCLVSRAIPVHEFTHGEEAGFPSLFACSWTWLSDTLHAPIQLHVQVLHIYSPTHARFLFRSCPVHGSWARPFGTEQSQDGGSCCDTHTHTTEYGCSVAKQKNRARFIWWEGKITKGCVWVGQIWPTSIRVPNVPGQTPAPPPSINATCSMSHPRKLCHHIIWHSYLQVDAYFISVK